MQRRSDPHEGAGYDHHAFKPWRIVALAFKAIRRLYPDYQLWRDFAYEYERDKLAIDVINGSPLLREWVDDAAATPQDLDVLALADERAWLNERQDVLRYGKGNVRVRLLPNLIRPSRTSNSRCLLCPRKRASYRFNASNTGSVID